MFGLLAHPRVHRKRRLYYRIAAVASSNFLPTMPSWCRYQLDVEYQDQGRQRQACQLGRLSILQALGVQCISDRAPGVRIHQGECENLEMFALARLSEMSLGGGVSVRVVGRMAVAGDGRILLCSDPG